MPLASEMVCAVDELTMAGAVSRYAVMVGFVRTGVVSVLFVSVSVVARPTRVSVDVGSVSVPVFEMVAMIGVVNVLFVSVSVVARPTNVSVEVGKVNVPVFEIVAMIGVVSVLFVSVSVVARPTKVSVEVGSVSVPVFEIVAMIGAVNVLFVSVSVVALPTNVSVDVGNVSVGVPATAGVTIVAVPDVLPVIATAVLLTDLPAVKLLTATLTVVPD